MPTGSYLAAASLDDRHPFAVWDAFRGNIVIVDFRPPRCGPCIAGLDKIARFEKDFAGQPPPADGFIGVY